MAYTIESINGCTKKLQFNFETLDLSEQVKQAVLEKRKSANLKGFRKGKAPLDMVQKMYGPQIESEALNQFVRNQFLEAIDKEKLKVVGYPKFENMKYDGKNAVEFDALVEVFPVIEMKDFSNLEFKKEELSVLDDDVDSLKKNYLESKAEMVEITDENTEITKGYFAVINFQGQKEDGERPENMKGEEHLLEIGSGQFIPGFEDGMMGMKKSEKRQVNVTFPADYHAPDLQSAKVVFDVELLEIKEKKYPELNDELVKEFGFESVEAFDKKNRESLLDQKTKASEEKLNQEIIETLVKENEFDVPQSLVEQQEEFLKNDLKNSLTQKGFNEQMMEEYFEKWGDDLKVKAIFQVRSSLILDQLAKTYNVETDNSDLDQKIEETAKSSGMKKEEIEKYYNSNEKIKSNLLYAIREEKTFKKLKENLRIS
ncbi:trigger factor [Bacteriovoracales bacterium]|nr:trigger factor [Bacteriovoracales bacterium]